MHGDPTGNITVWPTTHLTNVRKRIEKRLKIKTLFFFSFSDVGQMSRWSNGDVPCRVVVHLSSEIEGERLRHFVEPCYFNKLAHQESLIPCDTYHPSVNSWYNGTCHDTFFYKKKRLSNVTIFFINKKCSRSRTKNVTCRFLFMKRVISIWNWFIVFLETTCLGCTVLN